MFSERAPAAPAPCSQPMTRSASDDLRAKTTNELTKILKELKLKVGGTKEAMVIRIMQSGKPLPMLSI